MVSGGCEERSRGWVLELDCLGLKTASPTGWLCSLIPATPPLWAHLLTVKYRGWHPVDEAAGGLTEARGASPRLHGLTTSATSAPEVPVHTPDQSPQGSVTGRRKLALLRQQLLNITNGEPGSCGILPPDTSLCTHHTGPCSSGPRGERHFPDPLPQGRVT